MPKPIVRMVFHTKKRIDCFHIVIAVVEYYSEFVVRLKVPDFQFLGDHSNYGLEAHDIWRAKFFSSFCANYLLIIAGQQSARYGVQLLILIAENFKQVL